MTRTINHSLNLMPGRRLQNTTGTEFRRSAELFAADPARGEKMTAEAAGIFLDYSKNRITEETLEAPLPPGR